MTERARFFDTLRRSLGREQGPPPAPAPETALSRDADDVRDTAERIRGDARENAGALADELALAAEAAGWRVAVCETHEEAARYVAELARDVEARSVVRSAHPAVERLGIERALQDSGIEVRTMAIGDGGDAEREEERRENRGRMIEAGIGLTGVDYAIAETGSCAIIARQGASRLVSLLPPVHVAVVELGQVLPSLDELFALLRERFGAGDAESYMNIITGPSRSADIEYQLVTGVHGPGEVHMVIVGPVYLCIDKAGRPMDIIHKDLTCRRQENTSTTQWKPYPSIESAEADHWKPTRLCERCYPHTASR